MSVTLERPEAPRPGEGRHPCVEAGVSGTSSPRPPCHLLALHPTWRPSAIVPLENPILVTPGSEGLSATAPGSAAPITDQGWRGSAPKPASSGLCPGNPSPREDAGRWVPGLGPGSPAAACVRRECVSCSCSVPSRVCESPLLLISRSQPWKRERSAAGPVAFWRKSIHRQQPLRLSPPGRPAAHMFQKPGLPDVVTAVGVLPDWEELGAAVDSPRDPGAWEQGTLLDAHPHAGSQASRL